MTTLRSISWIVVDEVQKIPRLLDVIHRGIEQYKIKFALTGVEEQTFWQIFRFRMYLWAPLFADI